MLKAAFWTVTLAAAIVRGTVLSDFGMSEQIGFAFAAFKVFFFALFSVLIVDRAVDGKPGIIVIALVASVLLALMVEIYAAPVFVLWWLVIFTFTHSDVLPTVR